VERRARGPSLGRGLEGILLLAAALLGLAAGFIRTGGWGGAAAYLVLGLGTAAAPWLGRLDVRRSWLHVDALSWLLGFGALLSGVVMLGFPGQYATSRFDLVRPFLAWFGLAFTASGILVCLSQTTYLIPRRIGRFAPQLLGSVLFVFGMLTAIPNHDWVIFYGGFGASVVLLAVLGLAARQLRAERLLIGERDRAELIGAHDLAGDLRVNDAR